MSELKPCPFCGSSASVGSRDFGDNPTTYYTIACDGVDRHQLDYWGDTEEEAIENWNTRSDARIQQLEAELEYLNAENRCLAAVCGRYSPQLEVTEDDMEWARGVLKIDRKREGEMSEIEIHRKASVPDGNYCVDYSTDIRMKECEQLRSHVSAIGWEAGLGSPGSITHYRCALFDESLSTCYPREGFYGLTVKKCEECLEVSTGREK